MWLQYCTLHKALLVGAPRWLLSSAWIEYRKRVAEKRATCALQRLARRSTHLLTARGTNFLWRKTSTFLSVHSPPQRSLHRAAILSVFLRLDWRAWDHRRKWKGVPPQEGFPSSTFTLCSPTDWDGLKRERSATHWETQQSTVNALRKDQDELASRRISASYFWLRLRAHRRPFAVLRRALKGSGHAPNQPDEIKNYP